MSSICGNGYVQTSTKKETSNGCTTITTDGYYDNNNNGKFDKDDKFVSCSNTICE
ncbi:MULTISPECIES: hypothetical protein [unclassified Chryseobacterium]|uniref:hypothetical protein n=1 Tax=unclassified Chryseobacterium TaxID=2593645 RepID=UPI0021E5F208|nr:MULTISPECIES: hypothetical protein [unclassified Chryseobacterium]MEA1850076.1 hypothetical protein [Chryseobacterium sp. MHB01]